MLGLHANGESRHGSALNSQEVWMAERDTSITASTAIRSHKKDHSTGGGDFFHRSLYKLDDLTVERFTQKSQVLNNFNIGFLPPFVLLEV